MIDAIASASLDASRQTRTLAEWADAIVDAAPRISPADAQPLLAIFAEARKACDAATERFRELEAPRRPGASTVDHQALKRRREAALRLPPLDNGVRDPMLGLTGRTA